MELDRLNELRTQAVGPLMTLTAALKSAGNIRGQVQAVYQFMEDTALFRQISKQVQRQTEAGELEAAQETAQIWNALMECLQQIVSVLGETAQSSGELWKLLALSLSQYQVGTIPAVLDAVHFGGVDSIRGMEPKMLYVLGANEGVIPASPQSGSLLTERERGILLREMDMELAPDSEGAMERQLLQLYSAITSPTERLCVSYVTSAGGEQLQPSFLVGQLQALFPVLTIRQIRGGLEDAMTAEALTELYFFGRESGETDTVQAIRLASDEVPDLDQAIGDAKAASEPRELTVSETLSRRLFGSPVALTASRLDALGNCPLNFFLQYGLKARPRKEASFDAAEFGTFLHYILEKTVGTMTRENLPLPLQGEESSALVARL